MPDKDMTASVSESENPAIPSPTAKRALGRGRTRTGGPTCWTSRFCRSTRPGRSDGRGLQLRRGVQDP